MARELVVPPFDQEARQRIGEAISKAVRQGRPDYAALRG
jgi:hypothetical protein